MNRSLQFVAVVSTMGGVCAVGAFEGFAAEADTVSSGGFGK